MREHRLFLVLLAAGTGLRIVTTFAYRPALLYQDSVWYLRNADHLVPGDRKPAGYAAFVDLIGALWAVPVVQHGLALTTAVLLYALLLRLDVPRWGAALATAPFLLDAFQLLIEQYVLSETVLEALLVGACALLLWRPAIDPRLAALAGVLLALAALTRVVALVLIVPALIAVARPSRALATGALIAGFALPLGAYAIWFHAHRGEYGIVAAGGRFLYGRTAPFADCATLRLPADERPLCPIGPRLSPHQYAWARASPWFAVPAEDRERLAGDFARRAIRHQPLDYAGAVATDVLRGFALRRHLHGRAIAFADLWEFQPEYPEPDHFDPVLRADGAGPGRTDPGLVAFLRAYQRVAFTPGPLFALALLGGIAAAVVDPRRRTAPLLLTGTGFFLLLGPAATHQLAPRYVLPALTMFPPALAIAATALRRHLPHRRRGTSPAERRTAPVIYD